MNLNSKLSKKKTKQQKNLLETCTSFRTKTYKALCTLTQIQDSMYFNLEHIAHCRGGAEHSEIHNFMLFSVHF